MLKMKISTLARNRKGAANRRIIRTIRIGKREYQLHATKGWRSRRA